MTAPDGRPGVLLQLPDGYMVMNPEDAVHLAGVLVEVAAEVCVVADRVEWGDGGPGFGAAWPYGSCNALCDGIVCGWPRRADGTCPAGHPAQPSFTCPACGAVSHHPKDLEQGYCGRCHAWTGERL